MQNKTNAFQVNRERSTSKRRESKLVPNSKDIYLHNEPVNIIDGSPLLYIHGGNLFYERSIKGHMETILTDTNTHRYVGILDGRGNFRKEIAQKAKYKGNRDEAKKKIQETFPYLEDVREHLIEKYKFIVVHGIEADDLAGILNRRLNPNKVMHILLPSVDANGEMEDYGTQVVRARVRTYKSVISSIDKDLKTLDSYFYDLKTHIMEAIDYDKSFIMLNKKRNKLIGCGYKFKYAQILMGDPVDNIKGLHKCGAVGAYKILADCFTEEDCIRACKAAFYKKQVALIKEAMQTRAAELIAKGIKPNLKMPSYDVIQEASDAVYEENYNLITILERNKTVGDIKIQRYPQRLF